MLMVDEVDVENGSPVLGKIRKCARLGSENIYFSPIYAGRPN